MTSTSWESFHWPYKPKIATELEFGDWVIQVITHKDKRLIAYPPGQFLFVDHYVRDGASGKERWVLHLEVPRRGETMTWQELRRAAKSLLRVGDLTSPRTKPIRDVQAADTLLGLWTPAGRISQR